MSTVDCEFAFGKSEGLCIFDKGIELEMAYIKELDPS